VSSTDSSLDPLEIPVPEPSASPSPDSVPANYSLPQPFKHRGWQPYRLKIWQAIRDIEVSTSRSRRFAGCGAHVWVLHHREDPDLYRIVLTSCHDRFCLPCSRARAATIRANLAEHTAGMRLRFLTLTLAHRDEPLSSQLDRLTRAFKSLRGTGLWKERVRGGVAFLEVKKSDRTGRWHPHYHVVLDSDYLPQNVLSKLWLEVTGDSSIVDIRLVRDPEEVQKYVTKYVTKPIPAAVVRDPETLREAVQALGNRRMFIAFGAWRTWKLTQQADPTCWALYDHHSKISERADLGDPHAQAIIDAIVGFLYADAEPEFRVPLHLIERAPPGTGGSTQLVLW
jgi:hypothetical protein